MKWWPYLNGQKTTKKETRINRRKLICCSNPIYCAFYSLLGSPTASITITCKWSIMWIKRWPHLATSRTTNTYFSCWGVGNTGIIRSIGFQWSFCMTSLQIFYVSVDWAYCLGVSVLSELLRYDSSNQGRQLAWMKMRRVETENCEMLPGIIDFGMERGSLSIRVKWRLIWSQMVCSHCASAGYMEMLMAVLVVFNWRVMLNSGKADWQKKKSWNKWKNRW